MRNQPFIFAAICLTAVICAQAAPIVNVYPSVGPFYASPGYTAYAQNAMLALGYDTVLGQATGTELAWAGTPGTPGYYARNSVITALDMTHTDPNYSWLGVPNPGGAYAAETGNALYYGLHIITEQKVPASALNFQAVLPDGSIYTGLNYTWYGDITIIGAIDLVGIDYGLNGVRGGGDDIIYDTWGVHAATLPVNELFFVGELLSYTSSCVGMSCTPDQLAASLRAVANDVAPFLPAEIPGTYIALQYGIGGTGTVQQVVPEPGSFALLGAGLAGLLIWRRKR